MICSNCGTENPAGAKFCYECATRLAATCPKCGSGNLPAAKYCSECGTSLAALAAAATPSTGIDAGVTAGRPPGAAASPAAERRIVSILFADLVGFTPFAEGRDAEEVRDTLGRYFELATSVIDRYGGVVEKFIGDAVMAVWGAPTAHEDDAERAVRAGLDLVDVVRSLGPGIQARAGVLTGEAAVTIGAANQGMVAGDLVNTASRLQSVAPAGSVLVGEATQRAAAGAIAFEAAGEQVLKGKAAPVPAWRALRVVAERGGRNRSETLEAPFVGREDELRLLKELFHATSRERRVRLVSVIGPAGIGKSRLAWEFLKYIDGLVEQVWWHDGRSPAYGEGISFWALGEMVRGRCGLRETDDEATTRQRVAETVAAHVPDPTERAWVELALLALLGVEAGVASAELFAAWRTFFERLAASGPVIMVFEDHHFADSGLLDFVDHVLEWSRNVPIYVFTLARPELLDKRPNWGAGKRNFTSIYLEPLAEQEMRALLAGLVPGLPESAVRAIVARADGVPLYAVETVRMLVAEGRLSVVDGVYRPSGDLTSLAVPETLSALIASRLDRLEPADRVLVSDAAVLGQAFTIAGLSAVAGVDAPELEERLRGLVRRELLTLESDPRSPERGQYTFVQALIREVAYNTLSKKERKARHLAAARFFESLGSDELVGALAGQYLSAYESAPEGAEADALASQARIALRAAAERAVALGAHDQAIRFYEQAVRVSADTGETADLLERAGRSATTAARYDRAEEMLGRAVELRHAGPDRAAEARAIAALGDALNRARKGNEALALLAPAAEAFADLGTDRALLTLLVELSRAYSLREEHVLSLAVVERVLPIAEHGDYVDLIALGLLGKGAALANAGRLREGTGLLRVSQQVAREHDLHATHLDASNALGFFLGDIDAVGALHAFRDGLALANRLGHRAPAIVFMNNVGYAGFVVGEWDEGLAALNAGLTEDLSISDRILLGSNALIIRVNRGETIDDELAGLRSLVGAGNVGDEAAVVDPVANAALAQGLLDDARTAWHRGAELVPGIAAECFYRAGRGAIWKGDLDGVRADLQAVDATGVHGPIAELRRATLRAAIAALEGQSVEATSEYVAVIRAWHDLGARWDEALTTIDMATVLDPSLPEVRSAAALARELLARLGARPYLERLDAAMSRPRADRAEERTAGGRGTADTQTGEVHTPVG